MPEAKEVVLASASTTRVHLLEVAGISFRAVPAKVDEAAIRDALCADNEDIDPADVAEVLARAKAEVVSRANPGALVVGADQVLALGNTMFAKAASQEEARETLMRLRGETHDLHSAVVLAEGGEVTWAHVDTARITMRRYSASALTRYLTVAGRRVLESVGCYQIEGPGVQLFERIEGDYFTILGLPMLPLLEELRQRGVVPA